MPAPKGNRYYKLRRRSGVEPKYTATELLTEAEAYLRWCEDNPRRRVEKRLAGKNTKTIHHVMPTLPTLRGLRGFLGVSKSTWGRWRDREDLRVVVSVIEDVIEADQIQLAAVGMVSEVIVIRVQKLVEPQEDDSDKSRTHEDFLRQSQPDEDDDA